MKNLFHEGTVLFKSLKHKKCYINFILILLFVFLSGCATLPLPESPDSSAIIVSMKGKRKPLNFSYSPTQVFIASVDDQGYVVSEISNTYQKGKYFYFMNLKPGVYRIARGITAETTSTSSSSPMGQGSGFSVSVGFSHTSVMLYNFDNEIRKQTEVNLMPGQIEYMGHFSFIETNKLWPPGAIEVLETSGSRKEVDEVEALEYFKKRFKKSPWVTGYAQ